MSYGKRFVGPITPTVLPLRKELFTVPYHEVDWNEARNLCAKEDLYYPHPLVQDIIWETLHKGGELCSLRYDLTGPFARCLAMNKDISSFKRYTICKVYQRDNVFDGRLREFFQCDFNIVGPFHAMGLDFKVLKVFIELLDELNIGDYEVGSIAAGGRYGNLIGMFGKKHLPSVGVSLGFERVYYIISKQLEKDGQKVRATETQVLVSMLEEHLGQAIELAGKFWKAKLKAEYIKD